MCTDRGYVSFDIETDSLLPAPFDDDQGVPPVVFCAATMEMTRTAVGGAYQLCPARSWPLPEQVRAEGMTAADLESMVDYLWHAWTRRGLRLLAWNGLGFDLRVVAAHLRHVPRATERLLDLAWSCCDPMFAFFKERGFPVGLNAVARAGAATIVKSGHGADVCDAWAQGEEARVGVLAYCCRDVEVPRSHHPESVITGR